MVVKDLAARVAEICSASPANSSNSASLQAQIEGGETIFVDCDRAGGVVRIAAPLSDATDATDFDTLLEALERTWSRRFADGVVAFIDENGKLNHGVALDYRSANVAAVVEAALTSVIASLSSTRIAASEGVNAPDAGSEIWSVRI